MKKRISRRQFLSTSAATTAILGAATTEAGQELKPTPVISTPNPGAGAWVRWLDGSAAAVAQGVTWGTPWPRGKQRETKDFALRGTNQKLHSLQSWPLAYWPDGSLKWTAHALPPGEESRNGPFEVVARSDAAKHSVNLSVKESGNAIEVDTGKFVCRLSRSGSNVIDTISRGGREALRAGKLVLLRQDRAASTGDAQTRQESFESAIEKVTVEQRGPVRAVIKVEGKHSNGTRPWLPFTLRLYFYAGGENLRVLHTIVFDGDESKDFIRGIGLRFSAPLPDALYDRHVRFVGDDDGLFAEAVRGLTGLRRDPGSTQEPDRWNRRRCHQPRRHRTPAVHPRLRRLDAAAAELQLFHHPQAHRRRPRLARLGPRPSRERTWCGGRAVRRPRVRYPQFLAEPSGAARHTPRA
jgi:hypothetical protein